MPLFDILLPHLLRIILLVPVVRNHREHLLYLIAANTAERQGKFEGQGVAVALNRNLTVVKQLPILVNNLLKRVPIVHRIGIMLHIRNRILRTEPLNQ